jgi:hypothetical protein
VNRRGQAQGERALPFEIGLYGRNPRERRPSQEWKSYFQRLATRALENGVFKNLKLPFGDFV